jgi:isoleucyl-tRNA synthetase
MGYNHDRAFWEKWFPADLVSESFPGQFRNWFYAMLAMSTMMEGRPPFKTLQAYALMRDERGEEMHKSKGNAIPFDEAADRMSADLMRWMFSRHNPAHNLNFGYGPAEEVRRTFVLKLWNSYAFFCNYAQLDCFDPNAPPVPLQSRPDIDRWILSDLQLLVQKARQSFEEYNVQSFCLEAEKFVDERLSNWYVRRNRRRFWKSEQGEDKLAAYQTLYTVLVTLAKLLAPVVPFLAEDMYQNLAVAGGLQDAPESVHLCDYPQGDEALIDADLSQDMAALLRLVSLGRTLRDNGKINVRRPLAELKVQPADERERRAALRFADQIRDELNLKRVTLHDPGAGSLLRPEVKLNPRTAGPKYGANLRTVEARVAALDPQHLADLVDAGTFTGADFPEGLESGDLVFTWRGPEGWAGLRDRRTQLALDIRITEELTLEGLARDVNRHVQEARKAAGLQMDDRIILYLGTEAPTLAKAIKTHKTYLCTETLATQWATQPLEGDCYEAKVKVDGQPLTIQLRKANP